MSKKFIQIIIPGCILLLAAILRLHTYAEFPVVGETRDEYAWTMLGASLIQTQTPISWSEISAYNDYIINGIDTHIPAEGTPIVRPVFDHPPLFSILPGLAQIIKSDWWQAPSAKVIRLPVIIIGIINVFLLYLVAGKLFINRLTQIIAMAIYATAPLFVFSSRLVVAENLLITWILISLYCLYAMKESRKQFWLLMLISTAAVLTKMSGVIIPLGLIAYGLFHRQSVWKAGVLGLFAGLGLFVTYGAIYNFPLFVQVFLAQSTRNIGLATIQSRLFVHPAIVDKYYFDGWMIAGFLSMVYLLSGKEPKLLPVKLYFLMNVFFILFFVGEQTYHGWYDFTTFPLLVLAITYTLKNIWNNLNYLLVALLWVLLLPTMRFALLGLNSYYNLAPVVIKGIILLGFIPWGVHILPLSHKWSKISMAMLFFLILSTNIIMILTFKKELYWQVDDYFYFRGFIYP